MYRKIYYNVEYDKFELEQMPAFEGELVKEGIDLPSWYTFSLIPYQKVGKTRHTQANVFSRIRFGDVRLNGQGLFGVFER